MQLNLFRGKPGSGKSTSAQKMFPGAFLVENDMMHMRDGRYQWSREKMPEAIGWCISMVKTALEHGMDVCVANTFTKKRYVEAYKRLAEDLGASFHVYRCTGHFQNQHSLSEKMVADFKLEDWPGETLIKPA